jgi:hypothetical protein
MNITILGSGFGLYGYLPALLACNMSVILPQRYQSILLAREDIRRYNNCITWMPDQARILDKCDGIIFALPPTQQYRLLEYYLNYSNIKFYLLEKPLAPNPLQAHKMLQKLESSGKKFRIGYSFRYTEWGKTVLSQVQNSNNTKEINWHFNAHHYATNIKTWKQIHHQGGGALRFYGIHLIALLAEAGYNKVNFSKISTSLLDEAESWQAIFSAENLENCHTSIITKTKKTQFAVVASNSLYQAQQPFQTTNNEYAISDARIPLLKEYLLDLFDNVDNDDSCYSWYKKANVLWQQAEEGACS